MSNKNFMKSDIPKFQLIKMFETGNTLAESIVWDHRHNALMWTDIDGAKLYRSVDLFGKLEVFNLPERLGSYGLVEGSAHHIIAAFETGFALYDYRANEVQWLTKPALGASVRFNDGRVSRDGYFWAGTMIEDPALRRSVNTKTGGRLYQYLGGGKTKIHLDGIMISNSLCWSPDGKTQYFADTPNLSIQAYPVLENGLGAPRDFLPKKLVSGAPDGSCIDADGCLWTARWGSAKVVRISPGGDVLCELTLPVPNISCVSFGGPHLDLLCVTTARQSLSDAQLAQAPLSGNVFVYQTPFRGLAENVCTKL